MKILIVDDEKLARMRLHRLIDEIGPEMQVLNEAENGADALKVWAANPADVILMDIRMPKMDGLKAAQAFAQLRNPPIVIFTTAYDEHAIQAFEANAVDYLLKPIRKDRLLHALIKANTFRRAIGANQEQAFPSKKRRTHLCVNLKSETHLIPVKDIVFFRSDQKYVAARLIEREYLIDEPLKRLQQEFDGLFYRIHRNTLVSLRHIHELQKQPRGQLTIRLKGMQEKLTVSRRLAANFRASLKNISLLDD